MVDTSNEWVWDNTAEKQSDKNRGYHIGKRIPQ